jgi:hypothetical protein
MRLPDISLRCFRETRYNAYIVFVLFRNIFLIAQALKSLGLEANQIDDIGVQYLAEALTKNKVNFFSFCSFFCHKCYAIFNQTLSRVTLRLNKITKKGEKYIADLRRKNKVALTICLSDAIVLSLNRHWSEWNFTVIES